MKNNIDDITVHRMSIKFYDQNSHPIINSLSIFNPGKLQMASIHNTRGESMRMNVDRSFVKNSLTMIWVRHRNVLIFQLN